MGTIRSLPSVTCVVTAYNHARFVREAVESALAQDYPPELVDVVVVDDGSTDGTRELLDARFGAEPRVRLIHQANRGFVAAMNRALGEATGELIAILDGDDAWPAYKLREQARVLAERPEVGLVHGDMEMVDADGNTLNPSFFAYSRFEPARGRILGRLIRQNFVSGGASVVRSSLRERFHPIPEELLYPDWYIAARVAERAEIDHVEIPVNRYRLHGANMGLGGTGRKFLSDMRNNARVQRWMLANLDTGGVALAELVQACEAMLANAVRSAGELDGRATEVLPVSAEEQAAGALEAEAALDAARRGRLEEAARRCVAALARDPWNGAARAELSVLLRRIERAPGVRVPAPVTRAAAVLAFADELVEDPSLLTAYGRELSADDDVTLLIHAPAAHVEELGAALSRAVAEAGLDGDDAADLLLHPCEELADVLGAPLRAVYTRRRKPADVVTLPRVDDTTVRELRSLLGPAAREPAVAR